MAACTCPLRTKGTGKAQSMTICGGSGLPKDEIDRAWSKSRLMRTDDTRKTDHRLSGLLHESCVQTATDQLSDPIVKVTDKINALKEALKVT